MAIYTITSQETLERLSRHCPRAISTYLQCINRADENGKAFFSKELVINDMSESWTKFKNDLKALHKENILEWHKMKDKISITLASQENSNDE